jgi:hypothetical protein
MGFVNETTRLDGSDGWKEEVKMPVVNDYVSANIRGACESRPLK